jgi:peptidoglycan hydrolase CwlO-like protein
MQSKPIRNSDFDSNTAKHVTFYNENFKRGRCDLLKKIQRSTRGGGNNAVQDQQREVQNLKDQVTTLENKMSEMQQNFDERMRRLELDMLGRVSLFDNDVV